MALIAMAVYDTVENKRTELTKQTLLSLSKTVDFKKHRLIVIDNASCQETKDLLQTIQTSWETGADSDKINNFQIFTNEQNVGTAKAINQAWKTRRPKENLIKMDNDVVIHEDGWVDQLEAAIDRHPDIGIIGLKRKDLWENPNRTDGYKSILTMLPHEKGQKWIIVEEVKHVMGTCQMYNHLLIDKIGGLYQMDGLYGFDDSLASMRSMIAGFKNVFLPHIEIDHIDPGADDYTEWKSKYAKQHMELFGETQQKYINGELDIYHEL